MWFVVEVDDGCVSKLKYDASKTTPKNKLKTKTKCTIQFHPGSLERHIVVEFGNICDQQHQVPQTGERMPESELALVEFDRSVKALSLVSYFVLAFSFLLMIMIKHEIIHEAILVHLRESASITVEYRVGSENPVLICLAVSIVYFFGLIYQIRHKEDGLDAQIDAFSFPLLVCLITGTNEFSTILLMQGSYCAFNVALEDINERPHKQHKVRLIAAIHYILFYLVYATGEIFNYFHTTDQLYLEYTGLFLAIFDLQRMKNLGAKISYEALARFGFRMLLLVICFVKQMEYKP